MARTRTTRSLRWLAVAVSLCAVAAACGGDDGNGATPAPREDVQIQTLTGARSAPAPGADPALAGEAITAFAPELLRAVASFAGGDENVVVSPASVAIALAMLEPGATGDAREQMRALLRIDDPAAFHASMNALAQELEARVPTATSDGDPGEVTIRFANAAYLQHNYPFERAYLDTIGAQYGPVLHAVDFQPDPDAVAHEINKFVADATRDRITDLIDDGVIKPDTVLALVNALYLKASWLEMFDAERTADHTFTRLDGSTVTVPMMSGSSSASARGDGWVAATKLYTGGLAAQFVLPDEGRFDEIAADLATVLHDFDTSATTGALLGVPRFETRFSAELSAALQSLGLTAPYEEGNLLGIANDPRLVLYKAIHQTFVAMDEEGTEAAAATVLMGQLTSGPPSPPVPVILDRPFLFRIYDQQTGATLFLGHVLDPTG